MCSCIDLKDIILVVLGALLSVPITFLLFTLKPKLKIIAPEFEAIGINLKIPIKNIGNRNAVNLKIEACVINSDSTFHLELSKNDFIILPCERNNIDSSRTFHDITDPELTIIQKNGNEYTYNTLIEKLINESSYKLRVRVHASDDLTGFGKSFESSFTCENGKFILKT